MPATRSPLTLLAALLLLLTPPAAAAPALTPLAGSYSVGGTSPDYATLSAAVSDLNSRGISAPVTFHIRSGTYNEQVTITNFTRSGSPTDLVSFQRANPLVAHTLTFAGQGSANNYLVRLDGARYVALKGFNFQVHANATAGTLVRLEGGAHHISVHNSTLTGIIGSGDSLVYQAEVGAATGSTFTDNTFTYGGWGIELDQAGATHDNLVVTGNSFSGQLDGGIDTRGNFGSYDDNTFSSSAWSDSGYIAMVLEDFGPTITRSIIEMQKGWAGIWLFTPGGNATPAVITNNMLTLRGSDTDYGIFIAKPNVQLYHNTVYLGQAAPATSSALYLSDGAALDVTLHNNILYHASGGRALNADAASVTASDANNLYTTGATLVHWDAADYATLDDYHAESGFDGRSSSVAVTFVDTAGATDLHLAAPSTSDEALVAAALPSVPTDIDGDARNTYNATIGADEGDAMPPLSNALTTDGFYTVGGSAPDYANPNAALNALNRRGMQGPVTFRIRAGTYNLHRDLVYLQFGAGAPYTLTLRAANVNAPPTLRHAATAAADNYLLRLDDRQRVELRSLTLAATGTGSFGRLLDIRGDTGHLLLQNSTLNGLSGQTSDSAALVYSNADRATLPDNFIQHDHTFAGNSFNAGSYAIYQTGALFNGSGDYVTMDGNTFTDQTAAAIYSEFDYLTVTDNTIGGAQPDTIGIQFAKGNRHGPITGNQIALPGANTIGVVVESSLGRSFSNRTLFANNFVSAADGVQLTANSSLWRIAHNTLRARGNALWLGPDDSTAITVDNEVYNNIMVSIDNGAPLYIADDVADLASDYNNIVQEQTGAALVHYNGTLYSGLPAYRAASGQDAHSVRHAVTFVDAPNGDLHLAGASVGDVTLAGTPLFNVPIDIDGEARHITRPYMGADEAATPLAPPTAVTLRAAAAAPGPALWPLLLLAGALAATALLAYILFAPGDGDYDFDSDTAATWLPYVDADPPPRNA